MRRALLILPLVAVAALLAVLLTRDGGGSTYRVDAIFDSAKGIVPGQLVKIAGARVGTITDVNLTRGTKARLTLEVEDRFAPFRADASCKILPEGFISENYVECDPGKAEGELAGDVPTVPLARTAIPVGLQDVINIFSLPVDQRLAVLINELGLGTAGRGSDFNAILRRANPALTEANRALAIVDGQREAVGDAIGDTDRILAQLAGRRGAVRGFVNRSAAVARTTADHRAALGESVRRLPPLLKEIDGSLATLNRFTAAGTPLLADLRRAAPGLTTLTRTLPGFADRARPAVETLGEAADQGRSAIRAAKPVIGDFASTTKVAKPVGRNLQLLLSSLKRNGGFEGALNTTYALATMSSLYDSTSHIISIFAGVYPQCIMNGKTPGCSHAFRAPGDGMIPINAPKLGRQIPIYASEQTVDPKGNVAAPRAKPDPKAAADVLEYLLK